MWTTMDHVTRLPQYTVNSTALCISPSCEYYADLMCFSVFFAYVTDQECSNNDLFLMEYRHSSTIYV